MAAAIKGLQRCNDLSLRISTSSIVVGDLQPSTDRAGGTLNLRLALGLAMPRPYNLLPTVFSGTL